MDYTVQSWSKRKLKQQISILKMFLFLSNNRYIFASHSIERIVPGCVIMFMPQRDNIGGSRKSGFASRFKVMRTIPMGFVANRTFSCEIVTV